MSGSDKKLEKYLPMDFIPNYQKGMKHFHFQLTELNINIFILDKLIDFPFHLFSNFRNNIFFRQVFINFSNQCLLMITRMLTDQDSDFFTLPQFKNEIRSFVLENEKENYYIRLRDARLDKGIVEIKERARKLRSEQIAHMKKDFVFGNDPGLKITVEEIIKLKDALEKMYNAISFETAYVMQIPEYIPRSDSPIWGIHRTDIEIILDSIVEKSPFLHMPEENPLVWKERLKILSNDDKSIYDVYRKKNDLPHIFEVD